MPRTLLAVSGVGLVVYLGAVVWLGALDRGGPPRADVMLEGGVPGTLYLPEPEAGREAFEDVAPREARPPAVVLMHGFAGDRMALSTLARRLAHAGYAVLTVDVRGHGQNRTPFGRSLATGDTFFDDLAAAVDFLRVTPLVDGTRIVVGGHSMGAGASLDYGTRDSGIDGLVLISGGWRLEGPYRPPNALFIHAAGDPERIRARVSGLAARVAGEPRLEPGRTYGNHALGTAVRSVEVPGADHASIVWTEAAAAEIIAWIDASVGWERPTPSVAGEPRLVAVLIVGVAFLVLLPGLGVVVGGLVPSCAEPEPGGAGRGLLWLAAALGVAMVPLATGTPAAVLSVEVGDVVVAHFAVAGLLLLVALHLSGRLAADRLFSRWPAACLGAALATIAVFVLMHPIGVIFHRIALTPERILVFFLCGAGFLPLSLAYQLLLRRGSPLVASRNSLAGRALIVASLVAGVELGVLSRVVLLMLPAFVIIFVFIEVLAIGLYSASRNLLAIALVDAAWLSLIVATILPIRI